MTASPGNKNYGRLTVALAARCKVESLFIIKPGAFTPAPKVDSAFARLTPLEEPLITPAEQSSFDELLRHAFGQRRKQLQKILRSAPGLGLSPESVDAVLEQTGLDGRMRPEQLSPQQFVSLAETIARTTERQR